MKTKRVLVIDDNRDITDAISFYLKAIDVKCEITNSGRAGLDIIRNDADNSDIILLDLAMPDFSGFDVFSALREEGLLEKRTIVVFTASNLGDKEIQQMLAEGAKAILKKPVSIDELEQMIKRFS